jgi:hypothetical protein
MIFLAFGAYFISSWIRIRFRNADPDPKHWTSITGKWFQASVAML